MKKSITTRVTDIHLPVGQLAFVNVRATISRVNTGMATKKVLEDVVSPPIELKTKIYVYLQLKSMINIPRRDGEIELKLQYGNENIPRLDKECARCCLMKMDEMSCNVTFSFPVYQDSVESLNLISDNPVLVTLYERVVHSSGSEMEESSEEDIVIGQGYIDMLGYFQKKRFSVFMDVFIYPVDKSDQLKCGTSKATWQIYTLLPLLKNLEYSNIIFINFESLYNCTEDLMDDPEDLIADIVFRELNPSDRGKPNMIKICSFSGFMGKIIKEQNPYFKWESARAANQYASDSFAFQTDTKVNIYRLFKRLLRPNGIELEFKDIFIEQNEALVCNSMHRFVLTEELRALLEDVLIFRKYGLLVRIYRKGAPEEILLEGSLEPSVLLYPYVNAVRFAVVLQPSQKNTSSNIKKGKPKKDSQASGDSVSSPIFAIISVCLLTPLTESTQTIVQCKKSHMTREKYSTCHRKRSSATMAPLCILKERAYDSFDDWVAEVVDYIVQNNVREIDQAKNFFCCQSQNAGNKILALIALDFNQRFPTKNNIEFRNLMTTVYKELENRVYKTIEACGYKDLKNCRISDKNAQEYIISLINYMKLADDTGDVALSGIILKELKQNYSKNIDFNYYMFLNDVETGSFEDAKQYIARAPKERKLKDEYFVRLLDIYVQYMENLEHEEIYNEAFEQLIVNLTEFLKYYRKDFDGWILLYCLYKTSEYLPGMEFARWHYEDLNSASRRTLEEVPYPRWEVFLDYDIDFITRKGAEFYKTVRIFQSIGAYKFAQIVFNEIAKECTEIERYLVSTTLQVLLKEIDVNTKPREFADTTGELEASLNHVNGHLLYASCRRDQAMEYYENIMEIVNDPNEIKSYILGLKRYANEMIYEEEYAKALRALESLDMSKESMSVAITMGKAFYKLCHYKKALDCFILSTNHNLFIPDIWAYLALIHLKMGENFQALECWKYAKHIPNVVISKEIIDELNKIDVNEVDLYVDRPY